MLELRGTSKEASIRRAIRFRAEPARLRTQYTDAVPCQKGASDGIHRELDVFLYLMAAIV
jgi:hypothetical protein